MLSSLHFCMQVSIMCLFGVLSISVCGVLSICVCMECGNVCFMGAYLCGCMYVCSFACVCVFVCVLMILLCVGGWYVCVCVCLFCTAVVFVFVFILLLCKYFTLQYSSMMRFCCKCVPYFLYVCVCGVCLMCLCVW